MPQKVALKVVHVSGQDESYKASELNHHSPLTKGWQSTRFCLYPQDIVVQLEKRCRLRKIQILSHQFLVATKIEFYVGDVPDDTAVSLQNARYTRLGYVSLSDNEKTGFKARELKSVHVDAVGVFLKLVIHKNHINKYNLYNQVGIVAVNVIGDPLDKPRTFSDTDLYNEGEELLSDRLLEGSYSRPDYINPLDDLAFDMYQDPEVGQIIKKLDRKKQEAVLQERYDYAKRLKEAIAGLQKVGEKLGKMEIEKRQAVENEDYDKAKLKKVQMDEYRLQAYQELQINALLESRHPKPVDFDSPRQPTPPRLMELPGQSPPSQHNTPRTPYDDRPLPALKNKDSLKDISPPPPKPPPEERKISAPVPAAPVVESEPEPEVVAHPEPDTDDESTADPGGGPTEPEPMSEKDLRDASSAIDVFGKPLVSKAYSKVWSFREDALLALYKELKEYPASTPKEDAKAAFRAAIFLIKRAIDDKVFAVYKAALKLERMLLTEYVGVHKIPRHDVMYAVEKTLVNLLHKSSDMALRNREAAKDFILEISKYKEVKPTHVVPVECVKPFKLNTGPRLALSRTEIVEHLYEEHGLQDSLTVDSIMRFSVQALQHNSGEVREASERIIKKLYKEVGAPIKDYLPPDDEKTRKNTLYRMLFEYFDKVDGKPSKSDFKKSKAEIEAKKQAEIEELQIQLQKLKDMASGKAPINEDMLKEDKKKKEKTVLGGKLSRVTLFKVKRVLKETNKRVPPTSQVKQKASKPSAVVDDDTSTIFNIDNSESSENTCIFCGERNDGFTEEGLDVHYWKSCPMLKRCANCKQVVEIAGYTDHLLQECDAKKNFVRDPRCSEAVPKSEYDQHVADKSCNATKPNTNHCPLCHENIPAGEEGWKVHLMEKDGCKQNPRRLLALNKPVQGKSGAAGATKPKGRSGIPKPSALGKGKSGGR
ncbi:centrosomal protein of 104 kDa-like isoform X2 [Liolophura sinensis]|uniref:centrosomal protein of 104 kDa-like isoform X2 n=1 Tax=Liolophura sinensis TaxID=3198878 RepID=UPI0031588691